MKRLAHTFIRLWTIMGTFILLCTIFTLTTAPSFAASSSHLVQAKAKGQLAPATTGDWTTYMGSNARKGFNSSETVITTRRLPI